MSDGRDPVSRWDVRLRQRARFQQSSKTDLGDTRLNRRLIGLADRVADRPGESFPKVLDDAELEAAYRSFGNDQVTPEAILAIAELGWDRERERDLLGHRPILDEEVLGSCRGQRRSSQQGLVSSGAGPVCDALDEPILDRVGLGDAITRRIVGYVASLLG